MNGSGIKFAVLIQLSSKYFNVAVQLVITMVLARLLTPEQYGDMAIVAVVLGLFSILCDAGIGSAVVQYRDLSKDNLETLFSFSSLLGLLLSLVFALLSAPIAYIYSNQNLIAYFVAASPAVFFQAANMVPNGLLLREKKFKSIGLRLIVTTATAGSIAVILAFFGAGVYALIANSLLQSLFVLIWNVCVARLKPGTIRSMEPLKRISSFSSFQFLAQLLQYFTRNLDTMLIGAAMGSSALGFYNNGYKLAKYPVDYLPFAINPVLKSFYSEMQHDDRALFSTWLKVERVFSFIGVFVSIFFFAAARELVLLFFGEAWEGSVPIFRILSLSIAFQMINSTFGSILEAKKRTDLLFKSICITTFVSIFLLIVGIKIGNLNAVSLCETIAFVLYTAPVMYYVVRRSFESKIREVVFRIIPDFISGAILLLVYIVLSPLMPTNMVVSLALKFALGLLIYLLLGKLTGSTKCILGLFGH